MANFVCGMLGPGCFSVALSFEQSGLWAGLVLIFVVGFLSMISMYKIVLCSQHLCKLKNFGVEGPSVDYGDMAAGVCLHSYARIRPFENHARWIVNGSLIAFQLGVLSVCFVFVADHLLEVTEFFIGKEHGFSKTIIMLAYFIPQLCVNFELIVHEKYVYSSLPAVTNFGGVTMAAGGLMYAFEGQAMVLALENRLRHAVDMTGPTGVLCTAMNLVMLIYAFLGFFGYLTFGPLTTAVKFLLVAKIFLGSALQLYVIVTILAPAVEAQFHKGSSRLKALREYTLRLFLTVFSLTVAICVPNLYDIIPLVGITAGMLLSLILPAVLHTVLFLPVSMAGEKRAVKVFLLLFENGGLFLLGWMFLLTGLYSSIVSIMSKHYVKSDL
ncbi:unnamed protein product [Heligmosomoides polygyrus]|uniref:Amino acid transporter transmembrane domain-containing protein n=1 Tax=Heligmosomoides polygyrus TaxID=6339 RepID=A0A3P7YQ91_HELPZ|nr:unnamed protein product [Heligmosomoides polygyrus]